MTDDDLSRLERRRKWRAGEAHVGQAEDDGGDEVSGGQIPTEDGDDGLADTSFSGDNCPFHS